MACETMKPATKEEIIEKAIAKLNAGKLKIIKNPMTGALSLEGLTAAERGPMADTCIMAGIAARANMLTKMKLQAFGVTPEQLIKTHGHTH